MIEHVAGRIEFVSEFSLKVLDNAKVNETYAQIWGDFASESFCSLLDLIHCCREIELL